MRDIQEETGVYLFSVEQLEGYVIDEYYSAVTGRAIYGANFVKDFFARITDRIGGRVSGYERALMGAERAAMLMMAQNAAQHGANAVIGFRMNSSAMGPKMLMASCYGTAVRIRPR